MKSFLAVFLAIGGSLIAAPAAPPPVTLNWLGDVAPLAPNGITWGVPWPKGAIQSNAATSLTDANGRRVDVQTWPLAFWPDGSVKWTGHAIVATPDLPGPMQLSILEGAAGAGPVSASAIKCTEDTEAFIIDTGTMQARISKHHAAAIESLAIGGRVVARAGVLIALREDRSTPAAPREIELRGDIEKATLEQSGPVRAVIKLEGRHVETGQNPRAWLPFTLRLQFFAGSAVIRITHSFVFDGDGRGDFIKGIGLSFSVPFQEELHNRHIRFAGDSDGGVWRQPVRMLPGYRAQAGGAVVDHYAAQLAGERVPNLADFDPRTRENILTVPVWSDANSPSLGRTIGRCTNEPRPRRRGCT